MSHRYGPRFVIYNGDPDGTQSKPQQATSSAYGTWLTTVMMGHPSGQMLEQPEPETPVSRLWYVLAIDELEAHMLGYFETREAALLVAMALNTQDLKEEA